MNSTYPVWHRPCASPAALHPAHLRGGQTMRARTKLTVLISTAVTLLGTSVGIQAQLFTARDPGLRDGPAAAGDALAALANDERKYFSAGLDEFVEVEGLGDGLGPRFNLDSCVGCHSQPATGGSSPATNPQIAVATAHGAMNTVP